MSRSRPADAGWPISPRLYRAYYRYCAALNRLMPVIRVDGVRVRVLPHVYKPLEHEVSIVRRVEPGRAVLEVGCGCGVITMFLAPVSARVTAVDISDEAVENTRLNCRGLRNVTVLRSDMYARVEGVFDVIVSHPPYGRAAVMGARRQWATSPDFVARLFAGAARHLNPAGALLVIYPGKDEAFLQQQAAAHGFGLRDAWPRAPKSMALKLLGLLYFQRGEDTTIYKFQRGRASPPEERPAP